MPNIRTFHPDDRNAVTQLWETVFGKQSGHRDPTVAIQQKINFQPDLFLVAELDNDIIATAMGGYDGHRGWIYTVAVHPDHRRQKIATKIIHTLEQKIHKLGAKKINLQILPTNTAAVPFYQSLGYFVEPRISMGKILPD